ncbi:MAG: EAL domain-containing protein [Gammaproteobacteria bacterium]|nr:EAL domain-containing protein [Gammaproteobacteria bacterium]
MAERQPDVTAEHQSPGALDYRLLAVEDNTADARYLELILREDAWLGSFELQRVPRLGDALQALSEGSYHAVLLDLGLPDISGVNAVAEIVRHAPETPVVVLSGSMNEHLALEVVDAGAQDFLLKGHDDARAISRAVCFAIRRKQAELRLRRLAQFDQLTGLPNRSLFNERLDQALARARRRNSLMAVMFMDLDKFKIVNDQMGHQAGDSLLRQVGERVSARLRSTDTLARLGGDEFAIILEDLSSRQAASVAAGDILETFSTSFDLEDGVLQTTGSLGVAVYPSAGQDAATLLANADAAMYAAKATGSGQFCVYSESMGREARAQNELEQRMHQAIERRELVLHFQPVFDLSSGRIVSVESLVRWAPEADGELLPPGQFIPLAEQTGLIIPIGEWTLYESCRQARIWREESGYEQPISVNVSARQFQHPHFIDTLRDILRETALPASRLTLELSEKCLLRQPETSRALIDELASFGVGISVDNFGTGYCSLSFLKDLRATSLKIDQSFVRDLDAPVSKRLVTAMIDLAHTLQLGVIAEGVESQAQLDRLRELGAQAAQGYFLASPDTAVVFSELYRRNTDHATPAAADNPPRDIPSHVA